MMKTFSILLVLLIVFSGCSHIIVRTGYQISNSDYSECDVVINKFMHVTDSIQKLGEIKLGETGFAIVCSEAHAIKILRNEACAMQADIINIIEENRPDLWSSCYRCRAEFYKYKDPQSRIQSNELYQQKNVNKRVAQDRSQNVFVAVVCVTIGIFIGYLVVQ